MTNGSNGDFPYWEGDAYGGSQSDHRTQPAGTTEAETRTPQQLEALQSYLNQRLQPQSNFIPYQPVAGVPQQPPRQQAANAENPTISITAGKTRIDITITPL